MIQELGGHGDDRARPPVPPRTHVQLGAGSSPQVNQPQVHIPASPGARSCREIQGKGRKRRSWGLRRPHPQISLLLLMKKCQFPS